MHTKKVLIGEKYDKNIHIMYYIVRQTRAMFLV